MTQNNYTLFESQSAYEAGTADIIARNNGVGVGALPASRLVPRSQYATEESVDILVSGLLKGIENARKLNQTRNRIAFGLYKVTPANNPDAKIATSVNLAWQMALWHVIVDGGWEQGFAAEDINNVKTHVRKGLEGLSKILSSQATYTKEADYGEDSWQNILFGDRYERLLEIKRQYDPTALFNCWKCVGWLGVEGQMYSCYGNDLQPSVAT